jgi:hypothetical protein
MVFQAIQTLAAPHGTVKMDFQTHSNPIDYQTLLNLQEIQDGNGNHLLTRQTVC